MDFELDDGTALGTVVVTGEALATLPLVEPDDIVNVVGTVARVADAWVVVASDADAIGRAGDPVAVTGDTAPTPADPSAGGSVDLAGFDLPGTGPNALAGLDDPGHPERHLPRRDGRGPASSGPAGPVRSHRQTARGGRPAGHARGRIGAAGRPERG